VLAVVVAVVGVFVVRAAGAEYGSLGVQVAVVAGIISYVGTALSLGLSFPSGDSGRDTRCLLLSIAARTGIPLISVGALSASFGIPLASVFGMVLAYYLVALSVETLFAVQLIRSAH
jgi:hypothetical protein